MTESSFRKLFGWGRWVWRCRYRSWRNGSLWCPRYHYRLLANFWVRQLRRVHKFIVVTSAILAISFITQNVVEKGVTLHVEQSVKPPANSCDALLVGTEDVAIFCPSPNINIPIFSSNYVIDAGLREKRWISIGSSETCRSTRFFRTQGANSTSKPGIDGREPVWKGVARKLEAESGVPHKIGSIKRMKEAAT
jgi:hypothetical protein